jgi:flagellar motor switch protein FliG
MSNLGSNDKIAILLSSLGEELNQSILEQIPHNQAATIQPLVQRYRESPPDPALIEEVFDSFVRFFRFAMSEYHRDDRQQVAIHIHDPGETESADTDELENSAVESFHPSDDPIADLNHLHPSQVAAALREESPRTVAIVLNCLAPSNAGQVLKDLPAEGRGQVFLQLKSQRHTPENLVQRIARATVMRASVLDAKGGGDPENEVNQKLAELLRAMDQTHRGQLLESLREADADTADKIRSLLYVFEDIRRVTDRCIQKILREIDTSTLSRALKNCDELLSEKVLRNLSKRARATLVEEMEFLGSVKAGEQEVARKAICDAMANLDQSGDLEME